MGGCEERGKLEQILIGLLHLKEMDASGKSELSVVRENAENLCNDNSFFKGKRSVEGDIIKYEFRDDTYNIINTLKLIEEKIFEQKINALIKMDDQKNPGYRFFVHYKTDNLLEIAMTSDKALIEKYKTKMKSTNNAHDIVSLNREYLPQLFPLIKRDFYTELSLHEEDPRGNILYVYQWKSQMTDDEGIILTPRLPCEEWQEKMKQLINDFDEELHK